MISVTCRFGVLFFFFKQKTAYEMRISDWSSDVCSSDLPVAADAQLAGDAPGDQLVVAIEDVYLGIRDRHADIDRRSVRADGGNGRPDRRLGGPEHVPRVAAAGAHLLLELLRQRLAAAKDPHQIGSASCMERVCQYV